MIDHDGRDRFCDRCGRQFTAAEWEDRHWPHASDCLRRGKFWRQSGCQSLEQACLCEAVVHAGCCDECMDPRFAVPA